MLATTGMAVSVLDAGARTIHSFLGTFELDVDDYLRAWARTKLVPGVEEALRALQVFVLDEGSCSFFVRLPLVT